MKVRGRQDVRVVAQGGDGGTTDIGFGCLSGMFERNDDVLYICYDNEAYMNTGVQRSSATPTGAWTNSSPAKAEPKKDMMAIMAAQRNAKIVGIFARLYKRDGKPHYLAHLPRVRAYLAKDLAHPALADLKAWFEAHTPDVFAPST